MPMPDADDPAAYETDLHEAALSAYREVVGRPDEPAADAEAPQASEQPAESQAQVTEEKPRTPTEGRDEMGRFVAKAPKAEDGAKQPDQAAEAAAVAEKPEGAEEAAAEPPAAIAPPPSWSVKAKTAWDKVPPEVQAEIAKRESEMGQGLAALRDFKDLKPYAEFAQQNRTTIKDTLDDFIALNNLMGKDLAGGLGIVAERFGKSHAELGQMFATLAQRYGASVVPAATPAPTNGYATNGHAANGHAAAEVDEDDPLMQVLQPVLAPILAQLNELKTNHSKELNELKSHHSARAEADRNASVQSLAQEITRFAADPKNIYFKNVEADIARLFQRGMVPLSGNHGADLQTAYDLAVRMHPEIHQALIEKRLAEERDAARQREQEAAAKARAASRSLGGSRVPGTVIRSPAASDSDDIEATVRQAYRQHAQG